MHRIVKYTNNYSSIWTDSDGHSTSTTVSQGIVGVTVHLYQHTSIFFCASRSLKRYIMEDADLSFASLLLALRHSNDELDKPNFMPTVKVLFVNEYWRLSRSGRSPLLINSGNDLWLIFESIVDAFEFSQRLLSEFLLRQWMLKRSRVM
jgi:hypothetical protein